MRAPCPDLSQGSFKLDENQLKFHARAQERKCSTYQIDLRHTCITVIYAADNTSTDLSLVREEKDRNTVCVVPFGNDELHLAKLS